MDAPEDRRAIEAALGAMLEIAAHNAKSLPGFARAAGTELGLEYFGELEDSGAPILKFYRTDLGLPEKPSAQELPMIGKVLGFFTIPKQLLLGIRGERGDVLMKMSDIQVYRFESVKDYIRKQGGPGINRPQDG